MGRGIHLDQKKLNNQSCGSLEAVIILGGVGHN
jgi:hypothetical protein